MISSESSIMNSGPYAESLLNSILKISVSSFSVKLSLCILIPADNIVPLTFLTAEKSEISNGFMPWSFSLFPAKTGDD